MTNRVNEHEQWMEQALAQAQEASDSGDVPVGAILVRDGVVLARGQNRVERTKDPTAHAEMQVIREASSAMDYERLTDTTLYTTLEPCAMCAGAIVLARVTRLVIGTFDPKTGACGSLLNIVQNGRLNHHVDIISGVLNDECSAILRKFFKTIRER